MILCIGELLADMISERRDDGVYYKRCVGGAPFNVACAVKQCGGEVAFMGNVGADSIGAALYSYAAQKGLSSLQVGRDEAHNTTLAFVDLDEKGERSFTFYRKNTADYRLDRAAAAKAINSASIVHLGSLMLSEREGRAFAAFVRKQVKKQHKLLSFDVNFRDDIFPDRAAAVAVYRAYVEEADILKLSADELALFAPAGSLEEQMRALSREGKLVVVTLGKDGAAYCFGSAFRTVPTNDMKPVDTTGAGDAFWGALLSRIDANGFRALDESVWFANVCGAITTTRRGSAEAIPSLEEIEANL